MSLIQDRDIFNVVVFEYLNTKDLINLDTAIVAESDRAPFLEMLQTVQYKPPFSDSLEKWWKSHKKCLKWLLSRQLLSPEGAPWHMNKKLWLGLLEDTADDYRPFLAKLKDVFFEGFGSEFDLAGLEHCLSLEKLQLCNYIETKVHAAPLPSLPSLKHLVLQNCAVNEATLRNFMGATALKHLQIRHSNFEALPEDVVEHFMTNLQTVQVLNRVQEFFNFFCTRPNRIEVASFDMLHTTQNTEFSLEAFLKNSPHLRELRIERMCVDIQTVFTLVATYCPNLEFVHLNHVRLAVDGSSKDKSFDVEVPFNRLQISTLLPPTDDNFKKIISLTRGKLRHLHISFAERLTDGGYIELRDLCPYLTHLELEEKREIFDGEGAEKSQRFHRVVDYFKGSVSNIRVSLWSKWQAEHLKEKYAADKTVVLVKGSF